MENILTNDRLSVRMILTEGNKIDFFNYIKNLKIIKNYQEMLILSENHHFYYDNDELANVKLIMNSKKLNDVDYLDELMTGLLNNVSKDSYYCGCFINNKFSFSANNKLELLLNGFKILTDYPRRSRLFSIKNIYTLFQAHNFKIIDMEEINDLIYFCAKKID